MKIQTGIDIIEVSRIQEAIEKQGEKFLSKVYTGAEINYCNNTGIMKYQHYAARFAAKEAVFKALSSMLDNKYDIGWKDIQILNDSNGRPYVDVLNKKVIEIESIDISISHCKTHAVASVVIFYL